MANQRKKKKRTTVEKLKLIVEADQLRDEELGEFLRREGLHQVELDQWQQAAEAAIGGRNTKRKNASKEKKRIKELERELRRKEKALAEAAALLILKKKMKALYEARDNGTLDEYES